MSQRISRRTPRRILRRTEIGILVGLLVELLVAFLIGFLVAILVDSGRHGRYASRADCDHRSRRPLGFCIPDASLDVKKCTP